MKLLTAVLVAVAILVIYIVSDVRANYEYSRIMESYWDLSVKASTLPLKADYLDKFVVAVDSAHLEGHNAIFFPTPDNDVAQNLTALRSLQHRMEQTRDMDVTSFAYQQAISQITAQEQDEASRLLGVIRGRWFLSHHFFLWSWVSGIIYSLLIGFVVIGGGTKVTEWMDA